MQPLPRGTTAATEQIRKSLLAEAKLCKYHQKQLQLSDNFFFPSFGKPFGKTVERTNSEKASNVLTVGKSAAGCCCGNNWCQRCTARAERTQTNKVRIVTFSNFYLLLGAGQRPGAES